MDICASTVSAPLERPRVQLRYGRDTDIEFISWLWKRIAELPVHAETTRTDLDALATFKRHLRGHMNVDCRNVIVADYDGKHVGYVFGYLIANDPVRRGTVAHVDSLYVEPTLRGRGIGSALVRAFIADAQARGATEVTINVIKDNPAVQFYRKLGLLPWQYTLRARL